MTSVFKTLALYMGILLACAGLILPGMELLDAITAKTAVAQIIKIGKTCEKQTCLMGKCSWKRFKCANHSKAITEGYKVRTKNHAKLSFVAGANQVTAWASFSKLSLRQAAKGDTIQILYRGPKPYYVTTPFSFENARNGLLISIVGLLILASGGWLGTTKQEPAQLQTDHAHYPHAATPTRTTLWGRKTQPPRRESVVQRNTGWF